jgi:hypothetical protein
MEEGVSEGRTGDVSFMESTCSNEPDEQDERSTAECPKTLTKTADPRPQAHWDACRRWGPAAQFSTAASGRPIEQSTASSTTPTVRRTQPGTPQTWQPSADG